MIGAAAMPPIYVKLVLMAIMWSGVFVSTKMVRESMAVFAAVFLRFWGAAVMLLLLLVYREGRLPAVTRRQAALIVVLALIGISFYNAPGGDILPKMPLDFLSFPTTNSISVSPGRG